jgi:putative ABC transport system permease protein
MRLRRSSTQTAASRAAPGLQPWQEILEEATERARDGQLVLLFGAWLLGLLAVASVSVLVGGRMADQTRRVGLLKAVGGTPSLVAAVLLAEYLLVAIVAAAAGLAVDCARRRGAHRHCSPHRRPTSRRRNSSK